MSSLRTRVCSLVATARSSSSPVKWPERVVHHLEAVEVHEQDRAAQVAAVRVGDRLLDAVLEQQPVGELGQRIVEREPFAARRSRAGAKRPAAAVLEAMRASITESPSVMQRMTKVIPAIVPAIHELSTRGPVRQIVSG